MLEHRHARAGIRHPRLIDLGIAGSGGVTKSYDASGFRATFRAPLAKVEKSV